ncbi:MAG: phytoene desaturase [Acidobacteriaceae bacterium]|nr:phytoene desaturase [Acidobacteriaceae bacterium]MBV8572576.1 phytoene desaturase [Acidobacteriaceae bacterium]
MHLESTHRIGIIGSGLGGLSAACVLAARGYRVTVFEKNSWVGGKAAVLREGGFRFDMGPTILIYPSVLRKIFAEAGRELSDYLQLVQLEPQWRCFFEGGSTVDLYGDTVRMREQLAAFSPETMASYERLGHISEELHAISNRFFFWRSIGSMRDTFQAGSLGRLSLLRDVSHMKLGQTVHGAIRREVKDERIAQMVEHLVQYVGSSPEKAPAILCAIEHMQRSEGVWYPLGGTRAIPEALETLARELGVEFRTNVPVTRIATEANCVTGIETEGGEFVRLSAVVANSDAVRTYRELLNGPFARRFNRRRSYEPACSGVVLYLGLKRRFPQLAHHNFVFSRNSAEEFHAIYHQHTLAPDPTCYVCAPAITEPAVAPSGAEALYVLVHTPHLRPSHNWKEMFPHYRRVILDKLARTAGLHDLESSIEVERFLTPEDMGSRYAVWNGAIYGIASHGRLHGGFKPANHDSELRGFYLAGGAAHPGPGMPMVLMSGWIAADRLDRDQIVRKTKAAVS